MKYTIDGEEGTVALAIERWGEQYVVVADGEDAGLPVFESPEAAAAEIEHVWGRLVGS